MARGGYREGAGRPRGIKNRRSELTQEHLADLGCDPILALARLGMEAERRGEVAVAIDCYKALAPYYAPRLKSIELSAGTAPIAIQVITGISQPPDTGVV